MNVQGCNEEHRNQLHPLNFGAKNRASFRWPPGKPRFHGLPRFGFNKMTVNSEKSLRTIGICG